MSATIGTAAGKRRAIGIVRVSEVKGRDGDGFSSPSDQLDAIRAACARDGLELLRAVEELDVSGGTPLDKRAGMREAVEAVEAGEAQVIVAAYFDRLFRSLEVQSVILRRVEAAGGKVLALDTGEVTNGSAGEWLNATMRGMMAEYQRRTTAERSAAAQRRAIARGVCALAERAAGVRSRRRMGAWCRTMMRRRSSRRSGCAPAARRSPESVRICGRPASSAAITESSTC